MKDLKKFLLIITAAVVVALTIQGVWWFVYAPKEAAGFEFEAITVEAEAVRRGSIVRRISVVGTLLADNEVIIKPEIEGKISKINFEGGNFVEKGTTLVEIDDELYVSQLKEAKATLDFAKSELARYTALAAQSAGSGRNKEKAEAEKLQAEARFELAQIKLDNTKIKAPFSGVVGLKQYSVGGFVDPRTELLTLIDVDPIKVDFKLPATYLKSISRGQDVKVTIDSFRDEIFEAKIDAIDAKVDQTANSVLVRGIIPNPRGRLKPGLFARVELVVGAKDNILLVPETSVLSKVDEEHAFRVVEAPVKGVPTTFAVRVPVTTGLSEGGVIEIVRGLSEGDLIITVGLSKVRDQFPVRVVEDVEADEAFGETGVKPDSQGAEEDEGDSENIDNSEEAGTSNEPDPLEDLNQRNEAGKRVGESTAEELPVTETDTQNTEQPTEGDE